MVGLLLERQNTISIVSQVISQPPTLHSQASIYSATPTIYLPLACPSLSAVNESISSNDGTRGSRYSAWSQIRRRLKSTPVKSGCHSQRTSNKKPRILNVVSRSFIQICYFFTSLCFFWALHHLQYFLAQNSKQ